MQFKNLRTKNIYFKKWKLKPKLPKLLKAPDKSKSQTPEKLLGTLNFLIFRLYVRASFLGFRRGKSTQNSNQALLKIEGVKDRLETRFYMGKRVVYVYKVKNGYRVKFIKFFIRNSIH